MIRKHIKVYLIEFVVLSLGFIYLLVSQITFYNQIGVLFLLLLFYTTIGLLHHGKHHDINLKVVLEYILISALIMALFVFLNITRI